MRGSTPECVIKVPDGYIFTGLYKNFQQLSDDDKQAMFYERKCLNIPRKIFLNHRNAIATNLEEKEKTLDQIHREISSLKVKFKKVEERKASFFFKKATNFRWMLETSLEAVTKIGPVEVIESLDISPY